jgi:hypothetical protein
MERLGELKMTEETSFNAIIMQWLLIALNNVSDFYVRKLNVTSKKVMSKWLSEACCHFV